MNEVNQKPEEHQEDKNGNLSEDEKRKREERMDEELEQTFPASDPPSYSQPGDEEE